LIVLFSSRNIFQAVVVFMSNPLTKGSGTHVASFEGTLSKEAEMKDVQKLIIQALEEEKADAELKKAGVDVKNRAKPDVFIHAGGLKVAPPPKISADVLKAALEHAGRRTKLYIRVQVTAPPKAARQAKGVSGRAAKTVASEKALADGKIGGFFFGFVIFLSSLFQTR
jgi:dsRNA-specific ribonuclease